MTQNAAPSARSTARADWKDAFDACNAYMMLADDAVRSTLDTWNADYEVASAEWDAACGRERVTWAAYMAEVS